MNPQFRLYDIIRHYHRGKIMIEITDALNELSKKRPIFHSEADFQHALAWAIHEKYPDLNIRLENRKIFNEEKIYTDIFAFKDDNIAAIEVKYKTNNLDIAVTNEEFSLKNQSALPQGRYDFVKDISRLEKILERYHDSAGFAILLTNDESYWKVPAGDIDTVDKDFRIYDRKTIKGKLSWKDGTSKGTMRGKAEPIILKGKYILNWKDYSNLSCQKGKFRYLLVEVKCGNSV